MAQRMANNEADERFRWDFVPLMADDQSFYKKIDELECKIQDLSSLEYPHQYQAYLQIWQYGLYAALLQTGAQVKNDIPHGYQSAGSNQAG